MTDVTGEQLRAAIAQVERHEIREPVNTKAKRELGRVLSCPTWRGGFHAEPG